MSGWFKSFAFIAVSAMLSAQPAASVVLVDSSPVTFEWNPAVGDVDKYFVYTSRNGGAYGVEKVEGRSETTLDLEPGETLAVQVAAVGPNLIGPKSRPSELVMIRESGGSAAIPAGGDESAFILVDSCANVDVRPLQQTDRVDIADFEGCFSVRFESASTTESVRFWINGAGHRIENVAPYAIESDGGGDYHSWRKGSGLFLLEAVPYSGNSGGGTAGAKVSIGLEVFDSRR